MKTRFYIWVTSDCNLSCKWCSQKYTIQENLHYQMSMEEVNYIVESCKKRGIHFDIIEITGGEPSVWENIREGVKAFQQICDQVTLVTNGNNADLIISLNLEHWIVSASQATKEQLQHYDKVKHKIDINSHIHKQPPASPIPNTLPAQCCVSVSKQGFRQNAIEYIRGKVYYCCDAFTYGRHEGLTDDIVCDFENDFLAFFSDKKFDKAICQYCLCNGKVWSKI